MTLYQWGEDDLFDLQRMPGQKRHTHTPERKDPTVHTIDHPFCYDPKCTCRDNKALSHAFKSDGQSELSMPTGRKTTGKRERLRTVQPMKTTWFIS